MKIVKWNIEAITGYKPITTFYEDFSIADRFGYDAVRDTAKRGYETAKFLGYKELTELVMVLNHKVWEHYKTNPTLAEVYQDLWYELDGLMQETLKGEELQYYYRTLD